MTTDDILKLIMAGTGSAATLYTISHQPPPSVLGRTIGVDGRVLTDPSYAYQPINPILILGGIALVAFLVLRN